jgi:hypothetical protein
MLSITFGATITGNNQNGLPVNAACPGATVPQST